MLASNATSAGAVSDGETLNLPPDFVGRKSTYALRMRGNSMLDEHICDGDLIIVEDRATAENGETVIALLQGENVAVRTFYREGPTIRLQPRNSALEPLLVDDADMRIHGIVLGIMRRCR